MIKVQHGLGKKLFLDLSKVQAVAVNNGVYSFLLNNFEFSCMEHEMPEDLKAFCKQNGIVEG